MVTDEIEPTMSQKGKQLVAAKVTHTPQVAMTGPPTPPPTSAVELQDQARSIARERSTTAQVASETGTRPEIYQSAVVAVVETIQRNDYVGLVKVTERVDFTVNIDFLFTCFLLDQFQRLEATPSHRDW
jgi:hypothetical protein